MVAAPPPQVERGPPASETLLQTTQPDNTHVHIVRSLTDVATDEKDSILGDPSKSSSSQSASSGLEELTAASNALLGVTRVASAAHSQVRCSNLRGQSGKVTYAYFRALCMPVGMVYSVLRVATMNPLPPSFCGTWPLSMSQAMGAQSSNVHSLGMLVQKLQAERISLGATVDAGKVRQQRNLLYSSVLCPLESAGYFPFFRPLATTWTEMPCAVRLSVVFPLSFAAPCLATTWTEIPRAVRHAVKRGTHNLLGITGAG